MQRQDSADGHKNASFLIGSGGIGDDAPHALTLFREAVESEIDRMIAILDKLDGDWDLEDGADGEPWLGWPALGPRFHSLDPGDDREVENEHYEDGGDDEPSLGWPESAVAMGAVTIHDAAGDDRELDDDSELEAWAYA